MGLFRFGVSAPPLVRRQDWQDRARMLEALGYSTLLMPDHLGSPSCFAPLVSAAEATTSLRVGTLVANNDFFHPRRLAQEATTVDLLVDHRFELGLGSGWKKSEYNELGVPYDVPSVRAGRLAAAIREMRDVWSAAGSFHPPMLIGGHSDPILRLAASEATTVGLTGLTWSGGGLRPTGIGARAVSERVEFVRHAAGSRRDQLEFNALVQVVEMGAGAGRAAEIADGYGLSEATVSGSPFILLGDTDAVVDKLLKVREVLNISYFVVFDHFANDFAPVVARLAGK